MNRTRETMIDAAESWQELQLQSLDYARDQPEGPSRRHFDSRADNCATHIAGIRRWLREHEEAEA